MAIVKGPAAHGGFKFRRQHPTGHYVTDFCCVDRRLIVELDGSIHAQPSQAVRDENRDAYFRRMGYTILRLPNGIVEATPEEFIHRVVKVVRSLPLFIHTSRDRMNPLTRPRPSGSPSPPRGRGLG